MLTVLFKIILLTGTQAISGWNGERRWSHVVLAVFPSVKTILNFVGFPEICLMSLRWTDDVRPSFAYISLSPISKDDSLTSLSSSRSDAARIGVYLSVTEKQDELQNWTASSTLLSRHVMYEQKALLFSLQMSGISGSWLLGWWIVRQCPPFQ